MVITLTLQSSLVLLLGVSAVFTTGILECLDNDCCQNHPDRIPEFDAIFDASCPKVGGSVVVGCIGFSGCKYITQCTDDDCCANHPSVNHDLWAEFDAECPSTDGDMSVAQCVELTRCKYKSICEQKPYGGPCSDDLETYFFNATIGECEIFLYGGCDGNDNNFDSEAQCQKNCVPVSCCSSWMSDCFWRRGDWNNNHACWECLEGPCDDYCVANAKSDDCRDCCISVDHKVSWNCGE